MKLCCVRLMARLIYLFFLTVPVLPKSSEDTGNEINEDGRNKGNPEHKQHTLNVRTD